MTSFQLFAAAASAVFIAFGLPPVAAQDKPSKEQKPAKRSAQLSRGDAQTAQRLAQADMAEIETGKVAAQKASNAEVKKFAGHMVDDHSKMLEEGKKLAQAKGIEPPKAPDRKHRDALKKLQGMSGDAFDRAYMEQMVKDHEEALQLAEKAAKEAKDAELKAHAEKGAPRIKEHLAMARKIHDSLGASAGGGRKSGASSKQ